MDVVYFVDNIAQEIPVHHAVDRSLEYTRDDIPPVAVRALKRFEVGEKDQTARQPHGFILVDETMSSGPVMPSGLPPNRASDMADQSPDETFSGKLRLFLPDFLRVIEKFQEHDPGEHGEPVEVAVQSLVFAHDIAAGFDQAAELLRS